MTLIIAWLTSKLRILEWIVLALSWIGIAYATHHYDNLTQDHSKLITAQQTIKKVAHVKIIRDQTNALPIGAASAELLQRFHRPE